MKTFYSKFVAVFATLVIAGTFLAGALNGCATLKDHSAAVELIAQQAALRYIDEARPEARAARAARVIEVADEILDELDSDSVTVVDLASVALAKIPADLSPADRQLAVALVGVLAQELKAHLGDGTLIKPEDVTSVRRVIGSIRDAAQLYIP